MKIKLKAFAEESNDVGRYYRFAVIDTEKSRVYPSNFVCLLPTVINNDEKTQNLFSKIFGDKSQEQAELLLVKALKKESEGIVKDEISRRLALIAPGNEDYMLRPIQPISLSASLKQSCRHDGKRRACLSR